MDPYYWGAAWALTLVLAAHLASGQTETEEDEKRPYKFAFAIEGYQHRSEEKDERGIIMGEFGFVTGDGVYHVTVYATDENGNFKILKMKNYYVGLPGEGTTVAPTRAPQPPPRASTPKAVATPTTTPAAPTPSTTRSPILQHLDGLMGCGGCVIPKKKDGQPPGTAGRPPPNSVTGEGLIDERFGGEGPVTKPLGGGPSHGQTPSFGGGSAKPPSSVSSGNVPESQPGRPSTGLTAPSRPSPGTGGGTSPYSPPGSGGGTSPYSPPNSGQGIGSQRPSTGGPGHVAGGIQSTPDADKFGQGLNKPGSGNTLGKEGLPKPGQTFNGLPPGMTMSDLMELLYKFNYTLKYHGHHESGYRNGDKEGGYFFNGRDGLGRNVKYIANEFGFQPNITLVDLGLQSPDTPKGGDDELSNELKGYEFKWFYSK